LPPVFEALSIPPRMVLRAFDDLNALAPMACAGALPQVERDLASRVDELATQVRGLRDEISPLQATIASFHSELQDLRDKIPGI
jgi:hypothetical protein